MRYYHSQQRLIIYFNLDLVIVNQYLSVMQLWQYNVHFLSGPCSTRHAKIANTKVFMATTNDEQKLN